ncbi:MAG TPA: presenilin family intramembrane aspartyl protease [archaeon]|nr:presenilin family intramembrane aspartyl protease [archaeon]
MNTSLMAQFIIIFLLTQTLGLIAGNYLIEEQIRAVIVNEDPESVDNSIGLFVWILISTAILIILLRYAPELIVTILLKSLESFAIFATALIVMLPLDIPSLAAYAAAIFLVATRIIFSKNLLLRNISSTVSTAGAGALIGASIGTIPIIVFLIALSIYDFIAVFKTKHMVELAKGITSKNLSFTFAIPTKEHKFELGTGDLVVPLAFSVSALAASRALPFPYFAVPAIAILLASLSALILTLHFASKNKGVPLPALPLQAVLMIIVFAITKIAGY